MTPVQRQIVLPLRKAMEIAWKSIRMRLSRSLLVIAGIVLALAFFTSIRTTAAITDSLRAWLIDARPSIEAQRLESILQTRGVPLSETEIADNRIQSYWVSGLALLVAFVGILNAMLMSVTERFREIGTMKCLGALDGFIVKLFLLESLFQGAVGTAMGVAAGFALSFASLLSSYGRYAWVSLPIVELITIVAWSILIGVGLSVAAAVYPAWQAARMQPVEAMRVEA